MDKSLFIAREDLTGEELEMLLTSADQELCTFGGPQYGPQFPGLTRKTQGVAHSHRHSVIQCS